jgi:hypothetical protein
VAQTASGRKSPPLAEGVGESACPERLAHERCAKAVAVAMCRAWSPSWPPRKNRLYKAWRRCKAAGRGLHRDDIFRIASQKKAIPQPCVVWEGGSNWMIHRQVHPRIQGRAGLKTYSDADGTWTGEPARTHHHPVSPDAPGLYGVIDGDER